MFFFLKNKEGDTQSSGKLKWLLPAVGAALGILLLLWGGNSEQAQNDTDASTAQISTPQSELEAYQIYLEGRVRTLCQSVEGVDNVTVTVTLNGCFEEIYATEWIDGNEEYVIIGSGSNASALYLSRNAPEIAGIGVVCRGGGNTDVRRELLALLSAAFHVPANRIYITEAKF